MFQGANPMEEKPEKRPMTRRTVDYNCTYMLWNLDRSSLRNSKDGRIMRSNPNDLINLYPPSAYRDNSSTSMAVKHVHSSANKARHVVNVVRYTPQGRRVLTGSSTGEFTLWNGSTFNFELLNQAHDSAVRCMEWSRDGSWLISGDGSGQIKYWQSNLNNLKVLQAHDMEVRDLAFSPTSNKFVSASDDSLLKIWNFNEGREERTCSGHGWDVKCVDWHPMKGLIASGSKDNLIKLWDPRTEKCLSTLHNHRNTVMQLAFQPSISGNLMATCSRDSTSLVFDLRQMREMLVLRGHKEDVSSLCWHPVHQDLLTTGGSDGSVNHYCLSDPPHEVQENNKNKPTSGMPRTNTLYPSASIPYAHELAIWSMQYHPSGHMLCTGSNDKSTRFWSRARPGDDLQFKDRFHLGEYGAVQQPGYRQRNQMAEDESGRPSFPPVPGLPVPPPPPGLASLFANPDGTPRDVPGLPPGFQITPPPPQMGQGQIVIPGFSAIQQPPGLAGEANSQPPANTQGHGVPGLS